MIAWRPGRGRERGIALASVLWGVAALSLIAAAMLSSSLNAVRIGRNDWDRVRAQNAADAGLQRALLSLFDPRGDRRPPLDGTARDIVLDGASVSVSIQDETGRIDINYASRTLLRDLFKASGADAAQADALADRVVDWRLAKNTRSLNGASAEDYAHAGYDYRPRGGPFQSVDELGLVMGMTPQLLARLAPGLTVYSHRPDFDMRVAPKETLLAIPGMTEAEAEMSVAARDAAPARPGVITPAAMSSNVVVGHAYSLTAQAHQGRATATRQEVILLSGDPAHPYWVMGWK
jgi:general secretion pathway protein K